MINRRQVVAIVPARGGSTTVPDKNLRKLGDKPLVAWPIDVAHETDEVDRVIVSTDDDGIAEAAREYDAEVLDRPAELAQDDSLVVDALRHAINALQEEGETAKYIVMLEPTCPFRAPRDIRKCLELLVNEGDDSVATFKQAEVNPHRTWQIKDHRPETFLSEANPWLPRQALPEAYQLNGGVYAFELDELPEEGHSLLFGKMGAVVMPEERSIDIDTELDLALARTLVERDGRIQTDD